MTPWKRKEIIGDFSVTFVGDEQQVSIYAVSAAQGEPPVYVGSTAQILRHRIRKAYAQPDMFVSKPKTTETQEWLAL